MIVDDKEISYSKRLVKIAHLKKEWDGDIENPEVFIKMLKKSGAKADIFTFAQRLPDSKPKFNYYMEWDSVAAIPITSYEHWLKNQVAKNSRKKIRLAQRKGITIKPVSLNDELIKAILNIYHEAPVIRGVPNRQYNTDYETAKRLNSTYLNRARFIGAFYKGEMIAYIKLVTAGKFMRTMGILSRMAHREKGPMNLLLAKAVEICAEKQIPYLTFAKYNYGKRGSTTLKAFKKNLGFESIILPRYYIPLSWKGSLVLELHLHRERVEYLPKKLINILIGLRNWYYTRKYRRQMDMIKNQPAMNQK